MKVLFDARAIGDLQGIFDWIAEDSPKAADSVVSRIFESVERLGLFPELGRIGRDPETREWVIPGLAYIAVYEVDRERDQLIVVAVFHGAQDR